MRNLTYFAFLASSLPLWSQSPDLLPADGRWEFSQGGSLSLGAHARASVGTSTGSVSELSTHGHDPSQEDPVLQELDLSLSYRSSHLEAFANGILFTDAENNLDVEREELFLKLVDLPAGFELRGGRFLNRFGLQNQNHLHSWQFVDANLSTAQFLGEEGLFTEGAELNWFGETDLARFGLSAAVGLAPEHEEEVSLPGAAHNESVENSYFTADVATLRAFYDFRPNDFHSHRFGVNYGAGENGFGRDSNVASIDYSYNWRENGVGAGGREFSVGAEVFSRSAEWVHEDDATLTGTADQFGAMLQAGYAWNEKWRSDIRWGWIEGVTEGPLLVGPDIENGFEVEQRERLSLALTRSINSKSELLSGLVRLQYNYDDLENDGSEHSLWLQVGFDFGDGEVR